VTPEKITQSGRGRKEEEGRTTAINDNKHTPPEGSGVADKTPLPPATSSLCSKRKSDFNATPAAAGRKAAGCPCTARKIPVINIGEY